MRFLDCFIFLHIDVEKICIIDKYNATKVVGQVRDGAHKLCTMTLLCMSIDNDDANHTPGCWPTPVALANSLSLEVDLFSQDVESPKPVRRKNFIFSIVPNIDSAADCGIPKAWKTNEAMAWAILS